MSNYREGSRAGRSGFNIPELTPTGKILATILAIAVTTALLFFCIFMTYVNKTLGPELDVDASAYTLNQSSTVYYQANTGDWVELTKIHGTENRTLVDFEDIPDHVWQALVSIEDERFFKHHGVDWKTTFGAIVKMVTGSENTPGGSTITQQVIKNLTGENQVTIKRKVTEIFRALRFSKNYSHEEILELYLNMVYFGDGAYGIDAAADTYFGKDVSELSVAEAASIVGITQYPYMFDPSRGDWYREQNKTRQETVLYKMNQLGYLSDEDYEAALNEQLVFVWDDDYVASEGAEEAEAEVEAAPSTYDSYFVEQVFNDVVAALHEEKGYSIEVAKDMLYTGGYQIYATVKPEIQEIAESVYADRNNLNYTSAKGELLQSGMTIIDNETGSVVAIVGRMGEREGRFLLSYATNARPCGSAIKPVAVYGPALEAGVITPASVIDDYPVHVMGDSGEEYNWPVNAYSGYKGVLTLQDAIRFSSNPCAVRVLEALTPSESYAFMTDKLGFTTLTADDISAAGALALGGLSYGVTTLEMAAAYSAFANDGIYTAPRTFVEVRDHNGNTVLENNAESRVAMKESTAYAMIELLKGVVQSGGTGTQANFSGMNIAGKTGSTNSNCDRYFVGMTPYYTAAVWVGYDTPTRIVASGNPAAALWNKVMKPVHDGLTNKNFNVHAADMEEVTVCSQTGLLAGPYCSQTHTVLVAGGYAPTLTCDAHTSCSICADTGMLASDGCTNVTTAYVLDLDQPNVSEGWGYRRTLMYTPLTAAEKATYAARLEEGLISQMPNGSAVRTNEGTTQMYSDLLELGACTTHSWGGGLYVPPTESPITETPSGEGTAGKPEETQNEQDGSPFDWMYR